MKINKKFAIAAVVAMTVAGLTAACQRIAIPSGADAAGPVGSYREILLAESLEGVTFVDGRVVAESAPPLDVGQVGVLLAESRSLLDRGDLFAAIAAAVAAVRGAPELAAPYHALGTALIGTRLGEETLAAFATALDRDPTFRDARFDSATALQRLGRRAEAADEWRLLLARSPDHGPSHLRLASVLALLDESAEAGEHLAAALALGEAVPPQLSNVIEGIAPPSAAVHSGHAAGEPPRRGELVTVGPQVHINPTIGTQHGNETSAAATLSETPDVVAAWNDYDDAGGVRTGVGVSVDGVTWTDLVVRAPPANQSTVEGDPMTAFDPRTGFLWVGAISFAGNGGVFVARKRPGADVFEESVMTLAANGTDKGWMAAGPRPGLPDTTRLYVALNFGLQHSDDLGETFTGPLSLGSGVGFLPRVGPAGELYVSYFDYFDGHMVKTSFDGGVTLSPAIRMTTLMDVWPLHGSSQIPGEFRVPNLPVIAVDPVNGTVYCVYFDTSFPTGINANVDLFLTRSTDQGATWSEPVVVNGDGDPPGDQFFPWLEADGSGRLHLLFFDTRHVVQNDTDPSAWVDAYYAWSDDDGASWSEHRLTPTSFDSALAVTLSGIQFMGDYNGLAIGSGAAWPVYLSTQDGTPKIYTHEILSRYEVFTDGFESGDTSAWSNTLP